MGATGSGKSSVSIVRPVIITSNSPGWLQFVNLASGSKMEIGNDLESCTAEVIPTDEFVVDDKPVILIDTPGFDDTATSDADILRMIATYLAET